MNERDAMLLVDQDGRRATLEARQVSDNGQPQVVVRLEDGRRVLVPEAMLVPRETGGFYLPFSLNVLPGAGGDVIVLPVIAETVAIDKRTVERGRVRIDKKVDEREVTVDQTTLRDEVQVERVTVNRYLRDDEETPVRYEGDTMIVPLVEEVLVIEKRLVLREEVRITRRKVEERQPQQFTLRRETATVERLPPEDPSADDPRQE